jgi:hypothetical protein
MAMYTLSELRRKWAKGELTMEQVLGQLVQYVIEFAERLTKIEQQRRQDEQPPAKPQS